MLWIVSVSLIGHFCQIPLSFTHTGYSERGSVRTACRNVHYLCLSPNSSCILSPSPCPPGSAPRDYFWSSYSRGRPAPVSVILSPSPPTNHLSFSESYRQPSLTRNVVSVFFGIGSIDCKDSLTEET